MRLNTAILASFLTASLVLPCLSQEHPLPARDASMVNVTIQPGDLLEIYTFDVPELTTKVRVEGDGSIELPLIGRLHASDETPASAAHAIDEKLMQGKFLRDPHSSVFVKEYATQGVSVVGEVGKPGIYPMNGPRKLLDLLADAGGLGPNAACEVRIQHRSSGEISTALVSSTNSNATLRDNPDLQPGDTVFVSKAPLVYVIGDVPKPGGFTMPNDGHLSLLQALALAGGPNRSASFRHAKLIRQKENGELFESPVEIDRLIAGKAADTQLQANDIVFVPNSLAKSTVKRTLESIFQIATGMAIYSTYRGF